MSKQTITVAMLQVRVDRINKLLGTSAESYEEVNGKTVAVPGNYHLDNAYGKYSLRRMSNIGGGSTELLSGFHTKPQLYALLHAFLEGIVVSRETAAK